MRWGWDIDPLIKPNPSEPGSGKVLQYQPQMEQLIIRLYFFFVGLIAAIYNTELKFEQALRSHSINTICNKTCFPYAWMNHIVEPDLCLNPHGVCGLKVKTESVKYEKVLHSRDDPAFRLLDRLARISSRGKNNICATSAPVNPALLLTTDKMLLKKLMSVRNIGNFSFGSFVYI